MKAVDLFEIPAPGLFPAACVGEVVSVEDPENLGRVQVRVFSADGVGEQDGPIWARVAVPFAGAQRGAFLLPDVGDEVLLMFVQGDSRLPIVVGSLWNGSAGPPEQLGGDRVDRWTLVGKAGSRIAIVEATDGEATISLTTPGGVRAELTEAEGGRIALEAGGVTIQVDSEGVSVQTGGKVSVKASEVEVQAGQVSVDAGMSEFSGVVRCDTLVATTVVGSTYSPGAGNIW